MCSIHSACIVVGEEGSRSTVETYARGAGRGLRAVRGRAEGRPNTRYERLIQESIGALVGTKNDGDVVKLQDGERRDGQTGDESNADAYRRERACKSRLDSVSRATVTVSGVRIRKFARDQRTFLPSFSPVAVSTMHSSLSQYLSVEGLDAQRHLPVFIVEAFKYSK